MRRISRGVAAAALLLACAGCSFSIGGSSYEGADLEDDVMAALEKDQPDAAKGISDLNCPDTEEVKADAVTECTASLDGEPIGLTVTWEDDEGNFTVEQSAPPS